MSMLALPGRRTLRLIGLVCVWGVGASTVLLFVSLLLSGGEAASSLSTWAGCGLGLFVLVPGVVASVHFVATRPLPSGETDGWGGVLFWSGAAFIGAIFYLLRGGEPLGGKRRLH